MNFSTFASKTILIVTLSSMGILILTIVAVVVYKQFRPGFPDIALRLDDDDLVPADGGVLESCMIDKMTVQRSKSPPHMTGVQDLLTIKLL